MEALHRALGSLPLIAEDLGLITREVEALRDQFQLPGMRVLQLGFDGEAGNLHVPFRHVRESVVYTGTHDNDTTLGWYSSLDPHTRARVELYLHIPPGQMPEDLIRAALGSVGQLAVIPVQDLLGLGSAARLNTPGTASGNWSWRLSPGALTPQLAATYAQLNRVYGRA